jgi:hypothetical protein
MDDEDRLMQEIRKLDMSLARLDELAEAMEKTLQVMGKAQEALRFNHDDGYQPLPHN